MSGPLEYPLNYANSPNSEELDRRWRSLDSEQLPDEGDEESRSLISQEQMSIASA